MRRSRTQDAEAGSACKIGCYDNLYCIWQGLTPRSLRASLDGNLEKAKKRHSDAQICPALQSAVA